MSEIQIINRTSNFKLLGVQLSLLGASRVRPRAGFTALLAGFLWPRELEEGSWMWDEGGKNRKGMKIGDERGRGMRRWEGKR